MTYITEIRKEDRNTSLIESLTKVWKDSVRASHHFLSEKDICRLEPYAKEALQAVETLVVISEAGEPIGFMGIELRKIEMLFLAPGHFGQGYGRQLAEKAFAEYDAIFVDVNEQNTQAAGFYRKMGFTAFRRDALDDQGNSFPILRMKRDCTHSII